MGGWRATGKVGRLDATSIAVARVVSANRLSAVFGYAPLGTICVDGKADFVDVPAQHSKSQPRTEQIAPGWSKRKLARNGFWEISSSLVA